MTSPEKKDAFITGEIVWAKVKGYPWWPGEIYRITTKHSKTDQKEKQTIYRINFIGDNTHVDLPQGKIKKFDTHYEVYAQIKKKNLQKAIDKAKRMIREKNHNKHESEDEETQSIVFDDEEFLNKGNKKKQFIGMKRELKKGKMKRSKENNVNANGNASMNSHVESNNEDCSSSLCGLNRNPNNINIRININVTNNNHNHVNISSFENIRQQSTEPTSHINPNNTSQHAQSQNDDSDSYTEDNYEEVMKNLLENLIKYQIEVTNTSSHKYIISTLNDIKDLLSNETFHNLYELTKDIIPITHTFTYHKNHDIKMKSTELLSLITSAIISEVFNMSSSSDVPSNEFIHTYNENDINDEYRNDLIDVIEDSLKKNNAFTVPSNEIINALIYSKDKEVNGSEIKRNGKCEKKKEVKRSNNTSNVNNFNHNIDVDDKDFKFIYEDFVRVINNNNAVNTFDNISSDFYKNTYNKFNELDIVSSKKRKQVCLKLLSLLKKILIGVDIESLKKMIIFFEYQVRNEDPTFGKKYIHHIGSFYIKMKEILNEKEKDAS